MEKIRNKKGEKWLQINNFENYYISNYGRVYSKKRKRLLKPYFCFGKYLYVKLQNNGICKAFRLHRLVADAFISNDENKPIVHHINKNTEDNRAENLMWVTFEEHKNLHRTKRQKGEM